MWHAYLPAQKPAPEVAPAARSGQLRARQQMLRANDKTKWSLVKPQHPQRHKSLQRDLPQAVLGADLMLGKRLKQLQERLAAVVQDKAASVALLKKEPGKSRAKTWREYVYTACARHMTR